VVERKEIFIRFDTLSGKEEYRIDGKDVKREDVVSALKSGNISKLTLEYISVYTIEEKVFEFGEDKVKVLYEVDYPRFIERLSYNISKEMAKNIIDIIVDILSIEEYERRLSTMLFGFGTYIRPRIEAVFG